MRLALPESSSDAPSPRRRSKRRRSRFSLRGALALTALIGVAVGVVIAGWRMAARPAHPAQHPPKHATLHPRHVAALATAPPRIQTTPAPRIQTTPAPRIQATPAPRIQTTPAARASTTAKTPALQGTWEISEANRQVGSMVWSGAGTIGAGGSLVLDAHKVSIAGRAAAPCERETTLHAVLTPGAAPQTVPFHETNCTGAASTGDMRIAGFAPDAHTFSGTFWEHGVQLGEFVATKQ
jgi:hypothetical protein